ncbi:histidine kinase dimerization/phospho-acceptor domain-containing protein [Mycolicibacterium palauense]|uniref:histidine kinase dimerization/phospho-acceptor domain-containing protein n=1 Tax=Mycolicibacterium palauense TaxID=2034511 RepID=UPI000BFEC38E|nr:histidine kinase dimerization/phospho-acceptor domain-containing protein [Mycolicibacterium palauense]
MSEPDDSAAAIERLQRRLAREKSARLQAENIAERVASDRWELRQQLEEKLALRTSELEAARRTASEAVTGRQRCLSEISHELRTSLTALYFLAESLSEERPISAEQIEELRRVVTDMQSVMDVVADASDGADPRPARAPGSRHQMPLADVVSAHENGWHQAAARSGKLLILDVDTPSGPLHAGAADEVNQRVLGLIHERSNTSDPVIELHLKVGADGLEAS